MPEWLKAWWVSLTEMQRSIVIGAVVLLVFGMLASYVFAGTDYGPLGEWIQSWFD